jgi:hypothetical protein
MHGGIFKMFAAPVGKTTSNKKQYQTQAQPVNMYLHMHPGYETLILTPLFAASMTAFYSKKVFQSIPYCRCHVFGGLLYDT